MSRLFGRVTKYKNNQFKFLQITNIESKNTDKYCCSSPKIWALQQNNNWAKAFTWAKHNNAKLYVKGWTHIPIGSILRGDKKYRWYGGFFNNNLRNTLQINFLRKRHVITEIDQPPALNMYNYEFKATPYISDLIALKHFHGELKSAFFKLIKTKHISTANQINPPIIGVHIRRGDFVKTGSAIELSYFINVINGIRSIHGSDLAVTIFSDGFKSELTEILTLPNTRLFNSINDMVDLLTLSKSKIILTTLSSSFSYWAAFISDGIVIHHTKTWVPQCRPDSINNIVFEGIYPGNDNWPSLLVNNIKNLNL